VPGHLGGQTDARDVEEVLAVDAAEIDRMPPAAGHDRQCVRQGGRDLQGAREVVARADRQDAERRR
jgi:hypothetical protein